jgi:hypothetical protein
MDTGNADSPDAPERVMMEERRGIRLFPIWTLGSVPV